MHDELKTNLKRFLISLIMYIIVFTISDEYLDNTIIGISIVFISFIPLIYGLWGIVGLSTGDLIARLFHDYMHHHHYDYFDAFIFSLIVLITCFFIYKLYYSFDFNKKTFSPNLYDSSNLIKFIIIICVTNAIYIFIHIYYAVIHSKLSFQKPLIYLFIDNYVFITNLSLIFSLLIISIANLANMNIHVPKKTSFKYFTKYLKPFSNYLKSYSNYLNSYSKLINLMLIIYIIYLIYLGYLTLIYGINDVSTTLYIVLDLFFIVLLVLLKPYKKTVVKKNDYLNFSEFIIFVVLFLTIFSILFATILFNFDILNPLDLYNANKISEDFYNFLTYKTTLIQLLIIFSISIVLLRYLEKSFSNPLHSISKITKDYVKTKDKNKDEILEFDEKLNESTLKKLDLLSHNKFRDIKYLSNSFKEMIKDLEIYIEDLKRVTSEKERFLTELLIASRIQKDILPNVFPPFPDKLDEFDIYAFSAPAKNVGGDFYEYYLIDDDHLAIVIGDVSGKGIPAALFMTMTVTLIKDRSYLTQANPSEIFNNVNKRLIENNKNEGMFATSWLGVLELSTGKLTYVNAGHESPLISSNYSDFNFLTQKPQSPLGMMYNTDYIQYEITIKRGTILFLYSDGITESFSQDNEMFSKDRLLSTLNKHKTINIKEIIFEIKKDLNAFTHGMEQFDDETMIILEYKNKN